MQKPKPTIEAPFFLMTAWEEWASIEHLKILRQGVKAWNKWRKENPLMQPKLVAVKFAQANLQDVDLRRANLVGADLSDANLMRANFHLAELAFANLERTNLSRAKFRFCSPIRCNLTRAILTGAKLYGTARDDWIIEDVKCRCVYWDFEGRQRAPRDRNREPGECERLYATLPTIEYVFEQGMSPIDPLIMDRVVQAIREKKPEFDIKVDSINARGIAP